MPHDTRFDPIAEACRQWNAHWGRSATPAMAAVTSIMRVEQLLTARLNELLKPWSLTFPRYEALMLLYYSRRGALPLGKIGQRLQVHPTSVTNTVDGLQKLGYVERRQHEDDRRKWLAAITDSGRTAAAEATALLNEQRFATAPMTKTQLDTLYDLLRPFREAADAERRSDG